MIEKLYTKYLETKKVSTDTRSIEKGAIFFALKGPNFNANKFAAEALNNGAEIAVIDDPEFKKDERFWLVDDVLSSLQKLASFHRSKLDIPIIGLTGSNGKTTTKELVNAVLSTKYNVLATKGNLNNHIGVPLTILSVNDDHDIAIIEMGANHVGEISKLCEIARPTHGMITNIGKAHLEGFGGFEGVIRAKSELYQFLIENDGIVWINSENEILSNMAKRFKTPLFYPKNGDFYHCTFTGASPFVQLKTEEGIDISTNIIGKYNYENIAAALCIGKFFNVEAEKRNKAIASYIPANNRSQIIKRGSNIIILDAYNANPSSMSSALENLAEMNSQKKIAILGDMKELGTDSSIEHQKIGQLVEKLKLDMVYLFGDEIRPATVQVTDSHHFTNKVDLITALKAAQFKNATILIKGSRSMGLEEVLDVI